MEWSPASCVKVKRLSRGPRVFMTVCSLSISCDGREETGHLRTCTGWYHTSIHQPRNNDKCWLNEEVYVLASNPFTAYFKFANDPVGMFPGAEYMQRKNGKAFEVGQIAGWAARSGYKHPVIVNEDMKKLSECSPCCTCTCIY